jgi:hypothetical protein
MLKLACLMLPLALAAGCGGDAPPEKPKSTVFDPLVEQKQKIPEKVEAAQAQHDADTRRQLEAAEGATEERK